MAKPLQAKAHSQLPDNINLWIGRIAVRWAYLETYLEHICWLLSGVPPEIGRVAVRSPRASDRVNMIHQLTDARELQLSPDWSKAIKGLKKAVSDLEPMRDILMHSRWFYDAELEMFEVENLRGNHKNNDPLKGPTGPKRIRPEGLFWDEEAFSGLYAAIEALLVDVAELDELLVRTVREQQPDLLPERLRREDRSRNC